ncbi:transmembrane protein 51b [Limanda limanda]|uniref:transmembrane protein 51b n=1 Tax=Limanda limanda TaxID=27771 RepID=UPI0029C8CCBB|nr:transmembrane protein 51b [Limanda limanda]XP_060926216.1 transmembrane protein 51b [Limanda limanda]XP_060926217.1 transmembrane protein 51b [Limanda limanda]XP_060926218.1 transmembrane protein 51b [Limanda limanda]XP_060926219.1 transmembrane protein 51b [Limanda limanda]
MCSNRSRCGGNNRANQSGSEGTSSGAHYALCALGVGLIALGIVMIVWTVIPMAGEKSDEPSKTSVNSTTLTEGEDGDEEDTDHTKSSSVAMVLVGVGAVMLLLSLCLGLRSKRRARNRPTLPVAAAGTLLNHVAGEEAADPVTFTVPSYEEVVGSNDYPVRQSNLRSSTSQLPSYEDIIAAVENEGRESTDNPTEDTPLSDSTAAPVEPCAEGAQAEPPGLTSNPSLPTRSTSRASRLLRPLRVRRIKSDKLHLKHFRIQIRTPTQNPVTIEPITPPPQYNNEMPELQ